MGSCFSNANKVSGASSSSAAAAAAAAALAVGRKKNDHRQQQNQQQRNPGEAERRPRENPQQEPQQNRAQSRRNAGAVPCGKRTDFGYAKDFDSRYEIGKLLGHGQFGYTFVATDKANGERVAVKRIDKNKVACFCSISPCCWYSDVSLNLFAFVLCQNFDTTFCHGQLASLIRV